MLYVVDSKTGSFLIHVFELGFRTFSVAGDGERMQVAVGMAPETFRRALVRAKCLEKELEAASSARLPDADPHGDGGDGLFVEDDPEYVAVIAREEAEDPELFSALIDGKERYEVIDFAVPDFEYIDPSGMPEVPAFGQERVHRYRVSAPIAPYVKKSRNPQPVPLPRRGWHRLGGCRRADFPEDRHPRHMRAYGAGKAHARPVYRAEGSGRWAYALPSGGMPQRGLPGGGCCP